MNEKIVVDIVEQKILELDEKVLKILLKDRTTNKNIIWATDDYKQYGLQYKAENPIKVNLITGSYTKIIQPRVSKNKKNQSSRTRDKAEVFTPSWVCNQQNNLIDNCWFEREEVFNQEIGEKWKTIKDKIEFPKNKNWKEYVELLRMEITCGEAPYIVSRYDTVTGKTIKIEDRIGLLDRKLRIINENVELTNKKEWLKWVTKAFKSIYGFEYQGDNLLLARENLMYTFIEYYNQRFGEQPEDKDMQKIATIISWNIWQMDGIAMSVPYCSKETLYCQLSLFDDYIEKTPSKINYCKIKDWSKSKDNVLEYKDLMEGKNE